MSKTLVAYFSAGGVAAKLAKLLIDAIGMDLHEIRPEKPYLGANLDQMSEKSHSSVEISDKSLRLTVANKVENVERYSWMSVGFPIWQCVIPTIINTFLEQYDLTSKKVIPFVAFGSSGMGSTNAELTGPCKEAVSCDDRWFSISVKTTELKT